MASQKVGTQAAVAKVRAVLASDSSTSKLQLDYLEISDLRPLIPLLAQLPRLEDLDLHGNHITKLHDLSSLQSLRTLNIERNLFSSVRDFLPGLTSLPALKDLLVTLKTEGEEESVIVALPSLRRLNGTSLLADDEEGEEAAVGGGVGGDGGASSGASGPRPPARTAGREISLTKDDLQSVAVLYGAAKALKGQLSPEQEQQLTHFFDDHIQRVMRELSAKLEGLDDPFLRQGEILCAKHELYDICFHEVVQHAMATSPEFGAVLRKLRGVHHDLFHDFPGVLHEMRPHYVQRLADMHAEVVRAERESGLLLEAAEVLEKEAAAHTDEKERLHEASDAARRRLAEDNATLRAQNEHLVKRLQLVQSGRGGGGGGGGANGALRGSAPPPPPPPPPSSSSSSTAMVVPGGKKGRSGGASSSAPTSAIRKLTLKQCQEFIAAIYESKDAHLPRETMEQHMYTFLNQRYGLKRLIVSHASSIIKAVNEYSAVDNGVAVFGKVLRNEVDEEFREVQSQLVSTVEELLRVYLKSKFPLKSDRAIATLLASRTSGKGFLNQDEWVDIVKYMYNHEDSLAIIVMVKDLAAQHHANRAARAQKLKASGRHQHSRKGQPRSAANANAAEPEGSAGAGGAADGRVKYDYFLNVLLGFQLRGHEKFLAGFREQFRRFDADRNGVLSEAEFRNFVRSVDPGKGAEALEELLNKVDPFNNQCITFSDAVQVLSEEIGA